MMENTSNRAIMHIRRCFRETVPPCCGASTTTSSTSSTSSSSSCPCCSSLRHLGTTPETGFGASGAILGLHWQVRTSDPGSGRQVVPDRKRQWRSSRQIPPTEEACRVNSTVQYRIVHLYTVQSSWVGKEGLCRQADVSTIFKPACS